jgi:hypothetical protein
MHCVGFGEICKRVSKWGEELENCARIRHIGGVALGLSEWLGQWI